MKLINLDKLGMVPFTDSKAGLIGGPVTRQTIVGPEINKHYRINLVHFGKGAKNKFHIHSSDQVLIVTAGKGFVVTENKKLEVGVGDVIIIPAGEKHWHGATENSEFSHLYVSTADMTTKPVKE